MRDCEEIDKDLPVRQGDVLRRHGHSNTEFYVVISADCDIAQNKLGEAGVGCLRMLPLRDYVLSDLALRSAKRALARKTKQLSDRIHKIRTASDEDCLPIGVERLSAWISERTIGDVCVSLKVNMDEEKVLVREIETIQQSRRLLSTQSEFRAIDALRTLQPQPISRSAQAKKLVAEFGPKDLPLDVFFVCGVPGENHLGFVVDFRSLTFIASDRLFTSATTARGEEFSFLRVGRLVATFRHALAQQFGFMFSRIGLPAEYEREREATFSLTLDDLAVEES